MNPVNQEQTVERLEQDLRVLEEARHRELAAERGTQVVGWAIATSIAVIVTGFLIANYRHFRREWAEEKLAASLRRELDTINELAVGELEQLGSTLLPVYAEEGRRQFEALAPEISGVLAEQVESFGSDLQSDVRALLFESEERLIARTSKLVLAEFPALADPAQQALLEANLRRTTERSILASITDFDERFSADADALAVVVANFDVSDSDEPTVDLQKRFIRSWLHLLDEEIQRL